MNSEEGMSMAKMAVTVLLVVLVIGAVVAIVYAAYSWFGSGTDKLADNVTSISDSAMSQYDDQIVSGSDVLAALKNYRNADVAIFVCNATKQSGNGFNATPQANTKANNYCALVSGASDPSNNDNSYTYTLGVADEDKTYGGQYIFTDGFSYGNDGISINHNTNFSPTTTTAYSDTFVKQSADWYANLVYDDLTGDVAGIIFRQMN